MKRLSDPIPPDASPPARSRWRAGGIALLLLLILGAALRRPWQTEKSVPAPSVQDDSKAELFETVPPLPESDLKSIQALRATMDALPASASPQEQIQAAQTAAQAGDLWRAETLLRTALAASPADRAARLALAATLRDMARYQEAQALYAALNTGVPQDVEPYLGLARIALAQNQRPQTWNWLAQGMRRAAPTVDDYVLLSRAYQDLDSFPDARDALDKAAQIAPADPQVRLQRAALLTRYGQTEQANALLETLAREQPNEGYALRLLAVTLMNPGTPHYDLDRARTLLEQATELNPQDVEIYRLAAVLYRQKHLYRLAIQAYYALLSLEPSSVDARYGIGQMYAQIGRPDLSAPQIKISEQLRAQEREQTQLDAAVHAQPLSAAAHLRLALFLERTGHLADALRALQQADSLAPRDAIIRANLRRLYTRYGWRVPEGHSL